MTSPNTPQVDPRLIAQEKERLSEFPYFKRDPAHTEDGVLLSDHIEHYCQHFRMIEPFDADSLRPAGYDLRVGRNYAIGGQMKNLDYGESLTIKPYQVAVIQILETLNVPDFLIGRWNIRVSLAYDGLLWVGGAQVDPGFRGRLSCPIYNLSTQPVTLEYGQRLAMIDFVTTTTFKNQVSKPFQWWSKKVVFQQYSMKLQSGVEDQLSKVSTQLQNGLKLADETTQKSLTDASASFSRKIETIQGRIDTFVTLVFTVVAVLFAGLGVVATKGSDDPSFVSSPVWVAAVALYFALRPYLFIRSHIEDSELSVTAESASAARSWYARIRPTVLELTVGSVIVVSALFFHAWHAHISAKEIRQATQRATEATTSLAQEKLARETDIRELRQQSVAAIESLQQQIRMLQQNSSQPVKPSQQNQTKAK